MLLQFYRHRAELCVVGRTITFDDGIVIPTSLKNYVLKQLYLGHPGILHMKRLARRYVFWSGLTKNIENYINSFATVPGFETTLVKYEFGFRWSEQVKMVVVLDSYSKFFVHTGWLHFKCSVCVPASAASNVWYTRCYRDRQFVSVDFEEMC